MGAPGDLAAAITQRVGPIAHELGIEAGHVIVLAHVHADEGDRHTGVGYATLSGDADADNLDPDDNTDVLATLLSHVIGVCWVRGIPLEVAQETLTDLVRHMDDVAANAARDLPDHPPEDWINHNPTQE